MAEEKIFLGSEKGRFRHEQLDLALQVKFPPVAVTAPMRAGERALAIAATGISDKRTNLMRLRTKPTTSSGAGQ